MEVNKIICGDSLSILKTLPNKLVNCCITSPPYYGLRDYGTAKWEGGNIECKHFICGDGESAGEKQKTNNGSLRIAKDICSKCGAIRIDNQIGLERTPDEYVAKLVEIFREMRRALRDDGVLWLNLGDSYSSHKDCKSIGQTLAKGTSRENAHVMPLGLSRVRDTKMLKSQGLKNKDLIGIPWMVAFALRTDGWYLRQDIIWSKQNPMPESVTDRCTKSHEYIFLMSKSAKYYYDNEAIKELSTTFENRPHGIVRDRELEYDSKQKALGRHKNIKSNMSDRGITRTSEGLNLKTQEEKTKELRNKRSVWVVNTRPYKEAHFATFPETLIEPMILAGCPKDGIVLDPFIGAGTTGVVAKKLGRNYLGIELNPKYVEMAEKRIINTVYNFNLFE